MNKHTNNIAAFIVMLFLILLCACSQRAPTNPPAKAPVNIIQVDFFFGQFYSLVVDEKGITYVSRGQCGSFTDSLPPAHLKADSGKVFKLKFVDSIFAVAKKIQLSPNVAPTHSADAPRMVVYYNHERIYDGFTSTKDSWELAGLIYFRQSLPEGFNPFLIDETHLG